jgi:hypothetical protein
MPNKQQHIELDFCKQCMSDLKELYQGESSNISTPGL